MIAPQLVERLDDQPFDRNLIVVATNEDAHPAFCQRPILQTDDLDSVYQEGQPLAHGSCSQFVLRFAGAHCR